MKIKIANPKNYELITTSDSGKKITVDAAKEVGGDESGFRPMELVLSAIGSCSSIDVINILKKYQKPYRNYQVEIEAKRIDSIPKIFKTINLFYYIESEITVQQFDRAIDLALNKYCSVSRMIIPEVEISYRFEVAPY